MGLGRQEQGKGKGEGFGVGLFKFECLACALQALAIEPSARRTKAVGRLQVSRTLVSPPSPASSPRTTADLKPHAPPYPGYSWLALPAGLEGRDYSAPPR